ncbi:hypothetical protein IWW48_004180 [Coemansia sp. RSA 1200]|nr:hypothetical protein IWW48_004180 [Coemansia sp. RSA 1200]
MQTLNTNNRSSSSSVSDTLSNCSSIATSNTAPLTTAKNDSASEVHLGHSGTQNEHSDLRGAILNAYHAECEAELLRVENQALKERCSYLEEEAAKPPHCTKPHGMSSRDRGEISRLKADKILAQSKLERSERMRNLLKTDIEQASERYDSMYRYHRREIARLNTRNEALKDGHGLLKSQLDTACTEARTHAKTELAALTSLVAANLERAAFKRQIWELENRCTELRVEASKPTPCSQPHSTSRPRTYSQATTDAATMTEPLQSDIIFALPTPPVTPLPMPLPEP